MMMKKKTKKVIKNKNDLMKKGRKRAINDYKRRALMQAINIGINNSSNGSNYISKGDNICGVVGINNCMDKYYCTKALERGYDSVYIQDTNELALCTGRCATHRFDTSCPPTELRSNPNVPYSCNCSDSYGAMNCMA